MAKEGDSELQAIQNIISALEPLDAGARGRVLDYVFRRLEIGGPSTGPVTPSELRKSTGGHVEEAKHKEPPRPEAKDIRTLKEQKMPRSANQMAALVAYYLGELAPPGEHKEAIGTADVTRYFKQAGFPLPAAPQVTLGNAQNAGYFDPAGKPGLYKLNPVGYNLVVHGLPTKAKAGSKRRLRPPAKRTSKRATRAAARKGSQTRGRG